jgi:uncharacterized PurR-regulated membrane protein YhhQ (DUF165 family)
MRLPVLSSLQSLILLGLAVFGFLVPNGVFLWYFFTAPEIVREAMANPVALVFVAEAFFLMLLFAWVIAKAGVTRPGWKGFIALSLIGSMFFSVPLMLRRVFGGNRYHSAGKEGT